MGRGAYYDIKGAAEYCGYRCPSHFGQMLREYHIPLKGSKQNRYAQSDLDIFMENPRAFLPVRRKKNVSYDLLWE